MKEQELIESFSLVYQEDNYPPIAGKILGFLLVTNQKLHTFEEIIFGIKASKSATSKALKFLCNLEEVHFVFLDNNKRRRYFYLNLKGFEKRLEKLINAHMTETVLLKIVLSKRNEENNEMNGLIKKMIAFSEDVLCFLSDKLSKHFKTEQKN